jgi:hypothetical protein
MKYLIALLIFFPIVTYSQKIGDGVPNMYNSVGMVSFKENGNIHSGTGTLIHKIFENGRMKIFLVTCKHVLPSAGVSKEVQFEIHNDSTRTGITTINIAIFDSLNRFLPYVKFDPAGNDVAVIDITEAFLNFPLKNLQSRPIPHTLIATKDSLYDNNVQVGDEVLFVSYPNFYFNTKNKRPIMRSAVIATYPGEPFYFDSLLIRIYLNSGIFLPNKLDGFLIDGNAVGGSSGSLVFLRPQLLRNFQGELQRNITASDPMILGILSDSYFGTDPADNRRINLGGVVSGDAIKRTIDLFVIK